MQIRLENNLKRCRTFEKLKQEDVAAEMGVTEATISEWEIGYSPIPLNRLISFSNKHGYTINFLLKLTNDKTKNFNIIEPNLEEIGHRLYIVRTNDGKNKREFAKMCDIERTSYGKFENGVRLINTTSLKKICETCKVSADWILGVSYNMFLN